MVPRHPPHSCACRGANPPPTPWGTAPGRGRQRRPWRRRFNCRRLQTLHVEIFHPRRLFGMLLVPAAQGSCRPGRCWDSSAGRVRGGHGGSWGLPLSLPPSGAPSSQLERSSLRREFLEFPVGRGSRDACGWGLGESDPLPRNPLGMGGRKHPSPHCHGVWGDPGGVRLPSHTTLVLDGALGSGAGGRHRTPCKCGVTHHPAGTKPWWVLGGEPGCGGGSGGGGQDLPRAAASPCCRCHFGAVACFPCPAAVPVVPGLSPLLGGGGWG